MSPLVLVAVATLFLVLAIAVHDLYVLGGRRQIGILRIKVARLAKRRRWFALAFRLAPIAGGAITSFIPEVWSAELLQSLKKNLIMWGLANHDYEGEIKNAGDTVHINSVSRPTISTYDPTASITYESLTTADRTLVVDQQKYFAFSVDDVDARQAAGNTIPAATAEAAYGLGDVIDKYVMALYTGAQAQNQIANTSITTAAIAYTQLAKLAQKLTEANVPFNDRWVVVPPWYHTLLLDSPNFTSQAARGTELGPGAGVTGIVGQAVGMTVYQSNNVINITGNRWAVLAGQSTTAFTVAMQINQVEALRQINNFADSIRGLCLYGAKLIRPDALVTLDASST